MSKTPRAASQPGYAARSAAKVARAADLATDEMRKLATAPAVRRVMGHAREAARSSATHLPAQRGSIPLQPNDLTGVAPTGLLVDGRQARAARKTARALGLPRAMDGVSAWSSLGALAGLVRIADDGRRAAVVIDAAGPRSVFTRWASAAGFAPVPLDVADPDVVGQRIDPGGVDFVALLYPRVVDPDDLDVALVRASQALRPGGLVALTVQIGPTRTGGLGVADVRAFTARAAEQGLAMVGDLDLQDAAHASAALGQQQDRPVGLALLTFRRR